jgi:hypothetical protein
MHTDDKSSQRVYVHNGKTKIFDCNLRRNISTNERYLSKAEKRRYQRLISGLTVGAAHNERMRFMTLTTAKGVKRDINKSFDVLKKRIQRAIYKKDGFNGFKFSRYFKLKTAEGNGVLHIVYRGRYIPQEWLSKAWAKIHKGSYIVDIRELHWRKGTKKLTNYLIVNYLQSQKTLRMSYGWKWVWLGFCKSWENIKFVYSHWCNFKSTFRDLRQNALCDDEIKHRNRMIQNVLPIWSSLMQNPLDVTRQIKLDQLKKRLCVHKLYEPLGHKPKKIIWTCQTVLTRF